MSAVPEQSDAQLLAATAAGDRAAFEALYRNTSIVAVPALLLLAAVAWFLPHPVELVLNPTDPHWMSSHHHWTAVLATALVLFLWASHERA